MFCILQIFWRTFCINFTQLGWWLGVCLLSASWVSTPLSLVPSVALGLCPFLLLKFYTLVNHRFFLIGLINFQSFSSTIHIFTRISFIKSWSLPARCQLNKRHSSFDYIQKHVLMLQKVQNRCHLRAWNALCHLGAWNAQHKARLTGSSTTWIVLVNCFSTVKSVLFLVWKYSCIPLL